MKLKLNLNLCIERLKILQKKHGVFLGFVLVDGVVRLVGCTRVALGRRHSGVPQRS